MYTPMLALRSIPNAVIGMGAVVVKDILEPGIYTGDPAKKLKDLPSA